MRATGLALACLLASAPAAPGKAEGVPKAKQAKIRTLLSLTGGDKVATTLLETLKGRLPADQYERFARAFDVGELQALLVPVYDRHFSEQEIDQLIAFYRSPVGQRLSREMPAISSESFAVALGYMQKKLEASQPAGDAPHR